jgi:DNA-binding NarL/FixJ family response regulator
MASRRSNRCARSPDVLLLDLEMPMVDGVEALQRMGAEGLEVGVIIFTVFDCDERILGAL